MSAALIRLQQVTVTYAGQNVLDNIELSVEPGQIVTLIGPNGAGKTTLVKAVLGLLKPTSGSVWRKPRLRVGYMPQKLHVDPTLPLSVLRFLRLVPGVDRAQAAGALPLQVVGFAIQAKRARVKLPVAASLAVLNAQLALPGRVPVWLGQLCGYRQWALYRRLCIAHVDLQSDAQNHGRVARKNQARRVAQRQLGVG